MKNAHHYLTLLVLSFAIVFVACDKDEEELIPEVPTSTTETTDPAPPTPTIEGADGALWAIRSVSSQTIAGMTVDINIGLAVAAFTDDDNFASLVDVGTVEVDGNALTKNANNSYTFTPTTTDPTGIDFDNEVNWVISGGSGFQAFNTSMTITFPEVSEITSGTTVSKSAGYTLTVDDVTAADSVLFMVGDVIKYVTGNGESCTFSPDELAGLSNGTSFATVAGLSSTPTVSDGKTIYHGRETVQSKSITIAD